MFRCATAVLFPAFAAFLIAASPAPAQPAKLIAQTIAPGVWFVPGDPAKGYCNNIVIEMKDYLIVVDANYPRAARESARSASSRPGSCVSSLIRTRIAITCMATSFGPRPAHYLRLSGRRRRNGPLRAPALALDRCPARRDVRRPTFRTHRAPSSSSATAPSSSLTAHAKSASIFSAGRTRGMVLSGSRKNVLCTGDAAAVNGPHNNHQGYRGKPSAVRLQTLLAVALEPPTSFPRRSAGGPENSSASALPGTLMSLSRTSCRRQTLAQIAPTLPPRDHNWIPANLSPDFAIAYADITQMTSSQSDNPHKGQ